MAQFAVFLLTVRVAASVVALPTTLLKTARYWYPFWRVRGGEGQGRAGLPGEIRPGRARVAADLPLHAGGRDAIRRGAEAGRIAYQDALVLRLGRDAGGRAGGAAVGDDPSLCFRFARAAAAAQ